MAAVISDWVKAGMIRHLNAVQGVEGSQPPAGSHFSFNENRIISRSPIQKEGIAMAMSVERRMAWSAVVSLCRPEM